LANIFSITNVYTENIKSNLKKLVYLSCDILPFYLLKYNNVNNVLQIKLYL
jgi:hypothetical protein